MGKWRDNIRSGGSQTRQSERRETGWISPAASRQHGLPEAAIQRPLVRTYSWRWPGWVRGREQSHQEPLRSCAVSWLRIILINTAAHDGGNRPGDPDSLRGRVLILTICSWRTIRSGAGNHSETDLKTIAQYSNLVAAELEAFDQGYNDRFRGESADPDAAKSNWASYDKGRWDGGLFGAGWDGMRLLDNPDPVRIRMGDDGASLINGREDPGNQGWKL